jgi:FkbM family methyltransferase
MSTMVNAAGSQNAQHTMINNTMQSADIIQTLRQDTARISDATDSYSQQSDLCVGFVSEAFSTMPSAMTSQRDYVRRCMLEDTTDGHEELSTVRSLLGYAKSVIRWCALPITAPLARLLASNQSMLHDMYRLLLSSLATHDHRLQSTASKIDALADQLAECRTQVADLSLRFRTLSSEQNAMGTRHMEALASLKTHTNARLNDKLEQSSFEKFRLHANERISSAEKAQAANAESLQRTASATSELTQALITLQHSFDIANATHQATLDTDLRPSLISLSQRISSVVLSLLPDSASLLKATTSEGVFVVLENERISQTLLEGRLWDEHILSLLSERALKPGSLAIDVGAHIGSLTVPLAKRYSHVISLEPNAFASTLLHANILMNDLYNVSIINAAAWSEHAHGGTAPIIDQDEPTMETDTLMSFRSAVNLGSTSYQPKAASWSATPFIPLNALAPLIKATGTLDFIKIDAQGCDGHVLLGSRELLTSYHPLIVFEWEHTLALRHALSIADVEDYLHALGYRLRALHRHNDKQVDYVATPPQTTCS